MAIKDNAILRLLARENYITYHKGLAKVIGLNEAILFGELCSISSNFDDEEFYYSREKIIADTCLTDRAIRLATKTLVDKKLVSVVKKDIPCRYYYKLNANVLGELLNTNDSSACSTSAVNFDSTGDSNFDSTGAIKSDSTINKKINNKNIYKNIYINKKEIYKEKIYDFFKAEKLNKEIADKTLEWLEYKKEKKQSYTDTGLKALLKKIKNSCLTYGESEVVAIIDETMSCNYQGILFDKLKKNSNNNKEVVVYEPVDYENL